MDVRSPAEFNGEVIAPPGMTETAQRAGHIPGAQSIPWAQTVKEDGTFKDAPDLRALYEAKGVTADKDVIAYCRIGERSSHSWFVLHELLGYPNVRNYDGSWTEWGSMVNVPIEKAAQPAWSGAWRGRRTAGALPRTRASVTRAADPRERYRPVAPPSVGPGRVPGAIDLAQHREHRGVRGAPLVRQEDEDQLALRVDPERVPVAPPCVKVDGDAGTARLAAVGRRRRRRRSAAVRRRGLPQPRA